ncbi:hypothetical protein BD414DRAFT_473432 [Trametes punicea]|nr:hypothetical protein BD414DRAFT_473432 [Trametes punicea]
MFAFPYEPSAAHVRLQPSDGERRRSQPKPLVPFNAFLRLQHRERSPHVRAQPAVASSSIHPPPPFSRPHASNRNSSNHLPLVAFPRPLALAVTLGQLLNMPYHDVIFRHPSCSPSLPDPSFPITSVFCCSSHGVQYSSAAQRQICSSCIVTSSDPYDTSRPCTSCHHV